MSMNKNTNGKKYRCLMWWNHVKSKRINGLNCIMVNGIRILTTYLMKLLMI